MPRTQSLAIGTSKLRRARKRNAIVEFPEPLAGEWEDPPTFHEALELHIRRHRDTLPKRSSVATKKRSRPQSGNSASGGTFEKLNWTRRTIGSPPRSFGQLTPAGSHGRPPAYEDWSEEADCYSWKARAVAGFGPKPS